jgi:hypothetical protein
LIAVGGVFIVAVFSYNKWQEYKARKSVERAFGGQHDDVLMQGGRREPGLDHTEPGSAAAYAGDMADGADGEDLQDGHDLTARRASEPVYAPQAQSGMAADMAAGEHMPPGTEPGAPPAPRSFDILPVDNLIDCVISLTLESPIHGEKLLPMLQGLRQVANKPVHYAGHDGEWRAIERGGHYSVLRVGVQMASRGSALNELEYSELVMRLRQLADQLGAEPEVPDMIDVMTRARSLHQFVVEHDAQLGVNLQSNGVPWAMNTLLVALEKQGFDVRPDGRFVMPDGAGGYLFGLSTNVTPAAEMTMRLTLLLDVPCVAPERDGFGAMLSCAKALATRLDGLIVDDGNTPLSDEALGQIALQVQGFYQEMQQCQIPAGSTRALRLFGA